MALALVNLTLLTVTEELEMLLETYPYLEYRHSLKNPEFRQQLFAYVLSRIPNRHIVVDMERHPLKTGSFLSGTTEERMRIEELIYHGILTIRGITTSCEKFQSVASFNPVYSRF